MKGVLLAAMALAANGCEQRRAPPPPVEVVRPVPPTTRAPLLAGSLQDTHTVFEAALYFTPEPRVDPDAALRGACAPLASSWIHEGTPPPDAPVMTGQRAPVAQYLPPSVESARYFARGLSAAQIEAVQRSSDPYVMQFRAPTAVAFTSLHGATALVDCLGRATGGLPWDEETRELFTPESWAAQRLGHWTAGVPDLTQQITIHAYQKDDHVRAITLGMKKLALPDIVIDDITAQDIPPARALIFLVCETLAHGGRPAAGRLDVRAPNGRHAQLSLAQGRPAEGDPRNRLVEIVFDDPAGGSVHEQESTLFRALFDSSPDRILQARASDQELEAARRRVQQKLPELAVRFRAGLSSGALLQVKAPFPTPDGTDEYMWVEVRTWEGSTLAGVLVSSPALARLERGAEVRIQQASVFDYAYHLPDGTTEGDETSRILERRR